MRVIRDALLVSGILVLACGAAADERSPADSARDLDLTYRVYYGGFEVLRLGVDIRMAGNNYEMALKFRTQGMIGTLFPWSMKAYAKGVVNGERIRPVAAGNRNSWRGKQRWLEMRFPGRRPVVTDAHPPPEGDRPSPESLLDAIDLASAVFAMTRQFERDRNCGLDLPVFDGRRRYNLSFEGLDKGEIRRNGYSIYGGPVVKCRVGMKRLAGFKTRIKTYSGWGEGDRAASVFMGRHFIDGPPVPVRIELQTRWGDVLAHLTKAKLASGGKSRELAHRN